MYTADHLSTTRSERGMVSVVMSVYNGERFLRESVGSLLSQTHTNLEVILVNDGSRDRTGEVMAGFDDPRVVCVDRRENIGLTKSLNEGIARARGEYIARLDAGDTAMSFRMEQQVRFLEEHPDVGIVGSGIEVFSGDRALRTYRYPGDHDRIQDLLLHFVNPLPHSTLMIRREAIEQLEGYCPAFVRSQDYDLLLRALAYTKFASLPDVLVRWRFDPTSITYGSPGQLTYGIAALVRARHRMLGHPDFVRSGDWERLLRTIEQFIRRHHLDRWVGAAKHRVQVRLALSERRWMDCGTHAKRLLMQSPLFFIYTGTHVSAFIAKRVDNLLPCSDVCKQ